MSLVAKTEGGNSNFIPVPTGMRLARCYRIIDLGTQESTYMGNVKQLHKVMFQFEVHSEDGEGNPTTIDHGRIQSWLLCHCVCDEKGELLFKTVEQVESLKTGYVIEKLAKRCSKFNRLDKESVQDLEKQLAEGENSGSGSN